RPGLGGVGAPAVMTLSQPEPALEPNPLREGLHTEPVPEPCAMVIFGASGDLAHRKLIPALFQLATRRRLPAQFAVVGFARSEMSQAAFRTSMRKAVGAAAASPTWSTFARALHYCHGQYDDPRAYRRLGRLLDRLERDSRAGRNRVFYLATPP